MKAVFNGNDLSKGFNLVASVVPVSATKHVRGGAKIRMVNGIAVLTATDREIKIKYEVNTTSCDGDGSIALPAATVNKILQGLAVNREISMEIKEGSCFLESNGGRFKILGEDTKRFPDTTPCLVNFIEISSDTINSMASKVTHAVSTTEIMSMFNGVYVVIEGDTITMVAADGHRMSVVEHTIANPSGISAQGIIPMKCITLLQRFTSDWDGVLKVMLNESWVRFTGGGIEIESLLIDYQYPDYKDIIPKGNDKKVEIKKDDLVSALRIASCITDKKYPSVTLNLEKGKLMLYSREADVGETELEVNINYDGPAFKLEVNPEFILDAIKSLDQKTVAAEFGGVEDAIVFRAGHRHTCLVMPLETET